MSLEDQQPIGSGFGPRSEPHEVLADVDLSDKTVVVTGGYSGIGLETTKALASRGATIVVPVRSPEKAQENLAAVDGNVTTAQMDLADLDSVRAFTAQIAQDHQSLDLLINNAGVMATPERRVGPGWEYQFAINHLGHFVLTDGLMPLLRKATSPRVVALSSIAHKRGGIQWDDIHYETAPYDKWEAYAQAKTANALFALELSRRMQEFGGRAFSVHPGGIFTPLQRDLPVEEQIAMGWLDEDGNPSELAKAGFKSPSQGCTTTLWAATSPQLDDCSGVYCEDCDIAAPVGDDTPYSGVAAHAADPDSAQRLWSVTEDMLARAT